MKQSSKQTDDSNYDATYDIKYVDHQNGDSPLHTKGGKDQIEIKFNKNNGLKADIIKSAIDNNVPEDANHWKIASSFTYPGDQTVAGSITVPLVKATPVPYVPSRDDMSVTRKINYDVTGTNHAAIPSVTQTVVYTREDSDGNAGYKDPDSDAITWNAWHVKNNGTAQFPTANVTQIPGFDSYVDGTKSTTVSAANVVVTNGTPQNGATVTVTYQTHSTTPSITDADQYTPSYKDTTVNAKDPVDTGAPIFTTANGHQAADRNQEN